ncbi:ATP-binding protein [Streptomyces abyssomicinicus]|uniref:ATP-binding protein n=1 Tax=Streptomyces abyssomicinicus TaxID=574929 RepID=UPI00124FE024|nr:ATP-binding protein [Streptomyces abyssomicinicus]
MTSLLQDPLLWILLVVFGAAVAAVTRARRTNMALRVQKDALQRDLGAEKAERGELRAELTAFEHRHRDELSEVRQEAEEETKSVLKAAMRTLQVLADEQQLIIDRTQKSYGDDPHVVADLMEIDHANSQFNRRAQGIAVLCGGWLGRREHPASVYDVTRSAQGRIRHFDRVEINAQVNVTVVSKAVEPLAVVLAELLANATNYSAPEMPVVVSIQSVPNGVCLIVDDYGVGMSQEEKDRAAALLSPQGPVDLVALGNPPKFGFAVSGVLAARYGFRISVDTPSPYGGVRAVILLPEDLLTAETPAPAAVGGARGAAPDERPAREPRGLAPAVPAAVPTAPTRPVGTTAGGLPKRRRVAAAQAPARTPLPGQDQPEQHDSPAGTSSETTASRLGAFARGTARGRDTTTSEGSEEQ